MIPSTDVKKSSETDEIKFFGEVDIDKEGNVINATPAWMLDQHIEKEQEEIAKIRAHITKNMILPENLATAKARLEELESKVAKVKEGRPELTGAQTDVVAKNRESFGSILKEQLPSRSAIHKNLVRAQSEFDKNTKPYIELKDKKMIEFAQKCNVKVVGNKISRNGAVQVYNILSKAINADPNVENLRRD